MERGLPQAMRVADIRQENAYVRTLLLDGSLPAQPGQFVMVWLPGIDERPFSLASAEPASLMVAAVGPFSRALHALRPGDLLWLRGPLGRGFQLPPVARTGQPALLIAGGYGIAPLHFLAEQLLAAGYPLIAIIGGRSKDHLLRVEPFRELASVLWLTTEDGSAGLRGMVTDALKPALAALGSQPAMLYACGPSAMLRAVATFAQVKGLPMQLSWEARMRCGIGLCGSCQIGEGWLVCADGPVFPFDPLSCSPGEEALSSEASSAQSRH